MEDADYDDDDDGDDGAGAGESAGEKFDFTGVSMVKGSGAFGRVLISDLPLHYFLQDLDPFPSIQGEIDQIDIIKEKLDDQLLDIRRTLRNPSLEYVSKNNQEV